MEHQEASVQLATVTEQISSLKTRFESIEKKIDNLLLLGTSIAELEAHRENDVREREIIWEKIKEVNHWRPEHERIQHDTARGLNTVIEANSKAFSETCNTIEKKVDGWINKVKGGLLVVGLLMTIIQSLGAWYLVSTTKNIEDLQDRMNKVEVRLEIEAEVKRRIQEGQVRK